MEERGGEKKGVEERGWRRRESGGEGGEEKGVEERGVEKKGEGVEVEEGVGGLRTRRSLSMHERIELSSGLICKRSSINERLLFYLRNCIKSDFISILETFLTSVGAFRAGVYCGHRCACWLVGFFGVFVCVYFFPSTS